MNSFVFNIVLDGDDHRLVKGHYRFLVPFPVYCKFTSGEIEAGYIKLLQFRKPQAVCNKDNQNGFVPELCLLPVDFFMVCKTAACGNGIQHYHDLIVLESFYLSFSCLGNTNRVKSVSDVFIQYALSVKRLEHNRDR